jgi:hypothetical protein
LTLASQLAALVASPRTRSGPDRLTEPAPHRAAADEIMLTLLNLKAFFEFSAAY